MSLESSAWVGSFVIGLRRAEVERRLEELREELIRQASIILGLSVLLFGARAWFYEEQDFVQE